MVLAMLTRHFRQLWRVKELVEKRVPAAEIGKAAGIHPYFIRGIMEQSAGYSACRFQEDLREVLCNRSGAENERREAARPAGKAGNGFLHHREKIKGPVRRVPFGIFMLSFLHGGLTQRTYKPGEPGNIAGSIRPVYDPFGSSRVDYGDGCGQSLFGYRSIFSRYRFADTFYEGAQGRAYMLVSLVFLFILPQPFKGRFVVRQTAPPIYG